MNLKVTKILQRAGAVESPNEALNALSMLKSLGDREGFTLADFKLDIGWQDRKTANSEPVPVFGNANTIRARLEEALADNATYQRMITKLTRENQKLQAEIERLKAGKTPRKPEQKAPEPPKEPEPEIVVEPPPPPPEEPVAEDNKADRAPRTAWSLDVEDYFDMLTKKGYTRPECIPLVAKYTGREITDGQLSRMRQRLHARKVILELYDSGVTDPTEIMASMRTMIGIVRHITRSNINKGYIELVIRELRGK